MNFFPILPADKCLFKLNNEETISMSKGVPLVPLLLTLLLDNSTPNVNCTAQKMKFSIEDFFSKYDPNLQETTDLVTFTEEILNGKLHFLCSVGSSTPLTYQELDP